MSSIIQNLQALTAKATKKTAVRYFITGGFAFAVEMSVLYAFKKAGLSPVTSVAISFWAGFVTAFLLQKFIAFENRQKQPKILAKQLAGYSALVAWNYGFTLLVTALITPKVSVFLARVITTAIIVCWNYFVYQKMFGYKRDRRRKTWLQKRKTKIKKSKWFKNLDKNTLPARTKLTAAVQNRVFVKTYPIFATLALLASTGWWSLLSARIQQANADQLADPLLFESLDTFKNAQFPGSHTFLFKWPLFWAVKLFGYKPAVFVGFTVATAIITVALLAYILRKIERRPLIYGTLCLSLASALMLVPTLPGPGLLLPVNMAMLETRNLEYMLYIYSALLVTKATSLKSKWLYIGAVLLAILIVSDKLFLYVSLGGGVLALTVYALSRGRKFMAVAGYWLYATAIAIALAFITLKYIGTTKLTYIVDGTSGGPYGIVSGLKQLALAIIYAATGLLTNFGANPAFHTTELTRLPADTVKGLWHISGPSFVINLGVVVFGLYTVYQILRTSIKQSRNKNISLDPYARLSLVMIFSALAAIGVFVVSNHEYAVDARYLAMAVFAVFISIAVFIRGHRYGPLLAVSIGALLTVSAALGIFVTLDAYHGDRAALASINGRNQTIAQALNNHRVDALLADYWRAIPTKVISGGKINAVPLKNCTMPREVLNSNSWNKDLKTSSFAYLLSADRKFSDFPACTLEQVVEHFGNPNASLVIEGTLDNPKELLLFYDDGTKEKSSQQAASTAPSTVKPIGLDDLPDSNCDGLTQMNIVAHQDDDLLFMNPDIFNYIKSGNCVRTVYLTAGDAGYDKFYWLKREQGAHAAYDTMLGQKHIWDTHTVKLRDKSYATVSRPRGNEKVSLVFMRLPDGNVQGQGFGSHNFANLERLESGEAARLKSVDGNTVISANELVDTLARLMAHYLPAEVNTQSGQTGTEYTDHHDHNSTGRFARRAYDKYMAVQYDGTFDVPFNYYLGYPTHEQPENLGAQDFIDKQNIFLAYSEFDAGVCHSPDECDANPAYSAYLRRQYRTDN